MAFGAKLGSLFRTASAITNPFTCTGSVVVSVGDLIVAAIGERGAVTATTVTDNLGNTYVAQNAGTLSGSAGGRAYYSLVSVAGTLTTISALTTASAHPVSFVASVHSGPFAASPLDRNPANATDSGTPFVCPATGVLAQASELVVSWIAICNSKNDVAATAPLLLSINAPTGSGANTISTGIGYKVVSSTVTTTPQFTAASGGATSGACEGTMTFKAPPANIANPIGVSSSATSGTVVARASAKATLVGVAGTGAVGTVNANFAQGLPVGVSTTGAVGSVTVRAPANVSLTGVSSTGAVTSPTIVGIAHVTATGVASTGAVGAVTETAAANAPIVGVSTVGAVGNITVQVDNGATVTLAGVASTGAVGDVSVTSPETVNLTGVSATGAVGTVSASARINVTINGVAATGQIGAITVDNGISFALHGVNVIGRAGNVTVSIHNQYPDHPGHQLNYFFKFANERLARNDPVVGPFLTTTTGLFPVTVYNLGLDSVTPIDGYWCAVVGNYPVNPTLAQYSTTQFVLDRQLEFVAGQSAVIVNNLDPDTLSDLQIIIPPYAYAIQGLH